MAEVTPPPSFLRDEAAEFIRISLNLAPKRGAADGAGGGARQFRRPRCADVRAEGQQLFRAIGHQGAARMQDFARRRRRCARLIPGLADAKAVDIAAREACCINGGGVTVSRTPSGSMPPGAQPQAQLVMMRSNKERHERSARRQAVLARRSATNFRQRPRRRGWIGGVAGDFCAQGARRAEARRKWRCRRDPALRRRSSARENRQGQGSEATTAGASIWAAS